jgi:hypothetical protein
MNNRWKMIIIIGVVGWSAACVRIPNYSGYPLGQPQQELTGETAPIFFRQQTIYPEFSENPQTTFVKRPAALNRAKIRHAKINHGKMRHVALNRAKMRQAKMGYTKTHPTKTGRSVCIRANRSNLNRGSLRASVHDQRSSTNPRGSGQQRGTARCF